MAVACSTQELSLRLRGTFLDLEPTAAAPPRRGRSEEPRSRGDLGEDAGAAAELRYVQQLRHSLAAIASPAAARLHLAGSPAAGAKASKGDAFSLATTAVPDDNLSAASLASGPDGGGLGELPAVPALLPSAGRRTRRAPPAAGGSNTSLAMLLMKGKAAEEPELAVAPDAGSRLSWADEAELPEASMLPASFGCSTGSAGHPELCNRPCMYVTSFSGCASGESCEYCHMEHPKRAPHLDKRHREMLRGLSPLEWATVIMPILEKKVEAVDGGAEGQAIVARIARGANLPEGLGTAPPQRHQRMMVLTLRAMTLKTLVATVQRSLPGAGQATEDACRELTTHLRQLVFAQ